MRAFLAKRTSHPDLTERHHVSPPVPITLNERFNSILQLKMQTLPRPRSGATGSRAACPIGHHSVRAEPFVVRPRPPPGVADTARSLSSHILAATARQSCVRASGMDDFERLLMAQNFRPALLNVVVNTDGPCGLIGCFFTDERQLSDSDLFFARGAAIVVGKRLSLALVYSPRPMRSSPPRSIP